MEPFKFKETPETYDITLIDFSSCKYNLRYVYCPFAKVQLLAFFEQKPPKSLSTIVPMTPPESLFHQPFTKTYFVTTGHPLFKIISSDIRGLLPAFVGVMGEASAWSILTAILNTLQDHGMEAVFPPKCKPL